MLERGLASKQDVEELFSNWETILQLSEKLLEELERSVTRWPLVELKIGQIFTNLVCQYLVPLHRTFLFYPYCCFLSGTLF
jgi:hypothetical protein